MFFFSEHRLIGRTLQDVNKQRVAAGAKPIGNTIQAAKSANRAAIKAEEQRRQTYQQNANKQTADVARFNATAAAQGSPFRRERFGTTGAAARGAAGNLPIGLFKLDSAGNKVIQGTKYFSPEQRRFALRGQAEGRLTEEFAKRANEQLKSGTFDAFEHERMRDEAFANLYAEFSRRDLLNTEEKKSRASRSGMVKGVETPETTRQETILDRAKARGQARAAKAGVDSTALGLSSNGSTTEVDGGTSGTIKGGKSGRGKPKSGASIPTSETPIEEPGMDDIVKEEEGVYAPQAESLGERKGIAFELADAVDQILGKAGVRLEEYKERSEERNDQVMENKKEESKKLMEFESEIMKDSLERQRRDEELIQEKIDRDYQRKEDRQIESNAKAIRGLRTQLGARYGGFGSGKGLEKIETERKEGERLVNEIIEDKIHASRIHANKLSDLESDYRIGMRDIIIRHDSRVTAAVNFALEQAQIIDNSVQDREDAIDEKAITLLRDTFNRLDNIAEEEGTALSNHRRNILTRRDSIRAEVGEKKKDVLSLYKDHVTIYGNTNKTGLKGILKQMRDLGMDTSFINADAPTLQQVKNMESSISTERMSPGKWRFLDENVDTGMSRERDLGMEIQFITSNKKVAGTADERAQQANYLLDLLDQGQYDAADKYMDDLARRTFNENDGNMVSAYSIGAEQAAEALAQLDTMDERTFGRFKKYFEKAKSLSDIPQDQAWVRVIAGIESGQAIIRNRIYGAALTDQERALSETYLVAPGDRIETMRTKLEGMLAFKNKVERRLLDNARGIRSYSSNRGTPSVVQPEMQSSEADALWNESEQFMTPAGGGGEIMSLMPESYNISYTDNLPKVWSRIQTPVITGTITGYGSKKSAAGLDIAAPRNTPVRLHMGATVVKVVDEFRESFPNDDAKGRSQNGGYGNQVVVKFDNGLTGLFSHLDHTAVKDLVGRRLEPSTVLGYVGNTGNTYGKTGIHLDFELRDENGKKLSPEEVAAFMGLGKPKAIAQSSIRG